MDNVFVRKTKGIGSTNKMQLNCIDLAGNCLLLPLYLATRWGHLLHIRCQSNKITDVMLNRPDRMTDHEQQHKKKSMDINFQNFINMQIRIILTPKTQNCKIAPTLHTVHSVAHSIAVKSVKLHTVHYKQCTCYHGERRVCFKNEIQRYLYANLMMLHAKSLTWRWSLRVFKSFMKLKWSYSADADVWESGFGRSKKTFGQPHSNSAHADERRCMQK